MELKLEHVLLFFLVVLLFQMVMRKCNRLTEGMWYAGPLTFGVAKPGDECDNSNQCKLGSVVSGSTMDCINGKCGYN